MTEGNKEKINRVPLMLVLMSGAFVAILNQTLLATALPYIMADLHVDANRVQWLQSVFMLVNGIMIPISAFLIERFTTRNLFMTAMGLFALGTLVCILSPNFELLLMGRIFQASGAGIMMPLMMTTLFLVYPVDKRGKAMGYYGLIISFAPAIGPTLSGYLVENFHWHSLFYVVLPIAVLDLVIAYFILKNITEQTYPKVNILSIILSTLGFGGLLYGFSIAGNVGWIATETIVSLIIGVIMISLFIYKQLHMKVPILNFEVFRYKTFVLATSIAMVSFISLIGSNILFPMYMQNMLGFTALESGLMLLPGAIVMGMMSPINGTLFDKFGGRWLLTIGSLGVAITTFMFTNLDDTTTFTYLSVLNTFRMLFISMIMMPSTTAGLNALPLSILAHGTAMNNTLRQMAGAIGIAMLVSVMTYQAKPEEGVMGEIHGVNVSFTIATIIALIGFVLSLFLKDMKNVQMSK